MDIEQIARDALEASRSRGVQFPVRGKLPERIIIECVAGAIMKAHDAGVESAAALCEQRVAVTNYGEASYSARKIRELKMRT